MVTIHSILSVLAMSLMVNATPADIVARRDSVSTVTTFGAANCAGQFRNQYLVDRSAPDPGHIVAGTCVSEATYGSIAVDFVGVGCQFEKHHNATCADTPFDVLTSFNGLPRKCLSGEVAPAFWRVMCTS